MNNDRKIYRKYIVNHWWLKDYIKRNINQNHINKIFKKFNIKGEIIQEPTIIQELNGYHTIKFGIIKTDLQNIKRKNKFNKYIKLLDNYKYNILIE